MTGCGNLQILKNDSSNENNTNAFLLFVGFKETHRFTSMSYNDIFWGYFTISWHTSHTHKQARTHANKQARTHTHTHSVMKKLNRFDTAPLYSHFVVILSQVFIAQRVVPQEPHHSLPWAAPSQSINRVKQGYICDRIWGFRQTIIVIHRV